jgi:hypothetical protein
MSDIVERIRNRMHDAPMPTEHLLDEAADMIERLSAAVNIARSALLRIEAQSEGVRATITRTIEASS